MDKTESVLKNIIEALAVIIGFISGIAGFVKLDGATLQSQWAFGVVFGLLFVFVVTWIYNNIIAQLLLVLYNHSKKFKAFVDKQYGDEE